MKNILKNTKYIGFAIVLLITLFSYSKASATSYVTNCVFGGNIATEATLNPGGPFSTSTTPFDAQGRLETNGCLTNHVSLVVEHNGTPVTLIPATTVLPANSGPYPTGLPAFTTFSSQTTPATYPVTFTTGFDEVDDLPTPCVITLTFSGTFRWGKILYSGPASHPQIDVYVQLTGTGANPTPLAPRIRHFIVPANTTNDSRYENINGFNCNQQYNGCEIENPWGFWAGHISSNSPITTYGGGSICGATGNTTYGGGFAHCFIADTKVAMADGTEKNIQDVKLGDVLKGELGNNKVIGFHRPELGNEKLYSFNGGRHFVTAEHPFYTTDGWKSLNPAKTAEEHLNIEVSQLKVGDTLVTDHGLVKLRKVYGKSDRTDTQLYNFILDGDHTYYADGYLVHNKVGCSADGSGAPTYPQCPNGNYCLDNTPAPQGHLAYPPSSSNYGTCALPCSTPEPDPQAWCNSHPNGAFCSDDNFIHNCP